MSGFWILGQVACVYNMGPEIVFWSTGTDMVASSVTVPNNKIVPDLQHTAVERQTIFTE